MATSVTGTGLRFHRFFSHAAWDIDTFSMCLAKLVVTILAPVRDLLLGRRRHPLSQTRADPHGAGTNHDPLISSQGKSLVSWGHDWVVLTLIVAFPVLGTVPKSSPCPSPFACTGTAKG